MAKKSYRKFCKIAREAQKSNLWAKLHDWHAHLSKVSPEQKKVLDHFLNFSKEVARLADEELPEGHSLLASATRRLAGVLRECIVAGLGNINLIYETAINFGVISDPKTGGRFYIEEGKYFCWKCTTLAVEREDEKYHCPKCEP